MIIKWVPPHVLPSRQLDSVNMHGTDSESDRSECKDLQKKYQHSRK